MEKINESQLSNAREKFMNKRITFKTKNSGFGHGTCQFLGYNQYFPSWELQITVDRTPYQHVIFESIKLVEDKGK